MGLLLPNSRGAVAAFFGLQAFGRVPAMLNYTAGAAGMASACRTVEVRHVITARRFVEQAKLGEAVERLGESVEILYLEDLRRRIGPLAKLGGLLARPFAARLHRRSGSVPEDPAVVLFTSGSEGAPKGVALSHRNILANCNQLAARVDFSPADRVFNPLPIFHAFGLTGGTILPLVSGTRTFMYPSPLHYRVIPELVYATNATILFGTDSFLTGYARVAHPYDFYSLRYVFAGAEKVRDETRRLWVDRFGLRILEGYGATECAPVIATNTPMHYRAGTVGRFLPGIRHRLEPVPGLDEGGQLFVAGPNVMLGYVLAEAPGELRPPTEGWYDTGDIVAIDDEGFVTIQGRAKRFIKIAGEMVSLAAVEA
ncbi:MAG TPA: AMP-binding protein, partial [Kiloniellales bacterium]|nr:AMP-binding protein [Kiloniellales bacterium]